jgi:predicted secreted hydrolase
MNEMGLKFAFGRAARLIAALALVSSAQSGNELALPGYRYEFPRDHFSHPHYQTEWWYYTGNLSAANGRQFGFELTFFRFHPDEPPRSVEHNAVWFPADVFVAHFAITDIANRRFYHTERVNRSGPGLAGANEERALIWNGNWSARWLSYQPVRQRLEGVSETAHLLIDLQSTKPIVIHGKSGISKKGSAPGEASHYYSLTRLTASGTLSFEGRAFAINGLAWMDHEFFSTVKGDPVTGWDWMCVQLNTNQELMLYRLHSKNVSLSPFSSGTLVDPSGNSEFLDSRQFVFEPMKIWHSPETGANYPIAWQIEVPARQLKLQLSTAVPAQELVNKATRSYWEGAVRYTGSEAGRPVDGSGYLELTGYDPHEQH